MGGRREVSIIFYRPVTRRDLKRERSFFRRSVSSFLQLVVARVSETYPDNDGLVRKVRIVVATDALDDLGRPTKAAVYLERPVQKLVLLFPTDQVADRGIPSEEP